MHSSRPSGVARTGITPIGYRPWAGERTRHLNRVLVISRSILSEKIRTKGVLILLFIGVILVHAFPLIFKVLIPHEGLTVDDMIGGQSSIFGGGLFVVLTMLLAAVVSSDLISRDLSDNSFVLYFSRPIRPLDYLAGKMGGGFAIMSIFCVLPVIAFGVATIATQSGSEYLDSFAVLGQAIVAGMLASIFFLGYGMMLSSITRSRAYAGVGTFVSFFVLSLISGIFSNIDVNWRLVGPANLLQYGYSVIFGTGLPEEVNPTLFWIVLLSILIIPLLIAYWRIHLKAAGK
jgi:ABC-type transport system involved in multi-copper enzyme maturation permease subunit